jgi:hypothetical protein
MSSHKIESNKVDSSSSASSKRFPSKRVRLKAIKDVFVAWSKRSHIDGYTKMFEYESGLATLAWALIFLVSLALNCWFISLNIADYLEYGVVTSIVKGYEIPSAPSGHYHLQ